MVFRSGQGVGSIASANITILNDNIVEEVAETFTVRLTTIPLQPVRISGLDSATVTIQEDVNDGELNHSSSADEHLIVSAHM